MIAKQKVLSILQDMKTEENIDIISEYIDMITSLDDKKLTELLQQRGINSEEDVREFITIKTTREQHKFKPVNELISFGTNGATLHIHVIPKDLHNMLTPNGIRRAELQLIDALEKIKGMLVTDENYKNIDKVYAVSNLITRPVSRIFENLGFDVKSMPIEQARDDEELYRFYRRFKNGKKLGRAEISKEKILSEEWNKCISARKEKLEEKLGNNFFETLEAQVNTEVTQEEIKEIDKVPAKSINLERNKFNKEPID